MDDSGENTGPNKENMEFQQLRREVLLAVALRARIEPYVQGSEEERTQWKNACVTEALKCCKNQFGDVLLEAVGWTYQNAATQHIGKLDGYLGLGGSQAKLKARSRAVAQYYKAARSAIRAVQAQKKLEQRNKAAAKKREKNADCEADGQTAGPSPDEVKQMEATIPLVLETMLNISLIDVESTVRNAVKKVLLDMEVTPKESRVRADAINILGAILQATVREAQRAPKEDKFDAMKHMQDAYVRAVQKADEEKHTTSPRGHS